MIQLIKRSKDVDKIVAKLRKYKIDFRVDIVGSYTEDDGLGFTTRNYYSVWAERPPRRREAKDV